jgi:hypothetical protein
MIVSGMCSKAIAALVILGWISLSGFDVVEDLDEVPGQRALSDSSPYDNTNAKRGGWGPLANNMVESANRTQRAEITIVSCIATFAIESFPDIRRHFRLHKLYRVFLI